MTYSITFAKAAKRQFDKLSQSVKKQLGNAITKLIDNPRLSGTIKLSGSDNLYRLRSGDYRVIYEIHDAQLLVLVVTIGHRREIYRLH